MPSVYKPRINVVDEAIIALLKAVGTPLSVIDVHNHAAMRKYKRANQNSLNMRLAKLVNQERLNRPSKGMYEYMQPGGLAVPVTSRDVEKPKALAMHAEYSIAEQTLWLIAPGMKVRLVITP